MAVAAEDAYVGVAAAMPEAFSLLRPASPCPIKVKKECDPAPRHGMQKHRLRRKNDTLMMKSRQYCTERSLTRMIFNTVPYE